MKLFKQQCRTCLYGSHPAAGHMAEPLRAHVDGTESPFECHRSPLTGGSVLCRGYYERHRDQCKDVEFEVVDQPAYGSLLDLQSERQELTYARIEVGGRWGEFTPCGEFVPFGEVVP